ncbi:hypothetical protein E2C01_013313 [Portunus trituberculatus]|uniref:Uncharacterized protein n=1 Tax=Portunus trituberculatus TaxID=210409 RepID=A0A5B7DFX1_PORTR|nr:hypothetical protein [Portunus trituberculatus]
MVATERPADHHLYCYLHRHHHHHRHHTTTTNNNNFAAPAGVDRYPEEAPGRDTGWSCQAGGGGEGRARGVSSEVMGCFGTTGSASLPPRRHRTRSPEARILSDDASRGAGLSRDTRRQCLAIHSLCLESDDRSCVGTRSRIKSQRRSAEGAPLVSLP